jgi:hypothetical protein
LCGVMGCVSHTRTCACAVCARSLAHSCSPDSTHVRGLSHAGCDPAVGGVPFSLLDWCVTRCYAVLFVPHSANHVAHSHSAFVLLPRLHFQLITLPSLSAFVLLSLLHFLESRCSLSLSVFVLLSLLNFLESRLVSCPSRGGVNGRGLQTAWTPSTPRQAPCAGHSFLLSSFRIRWVHPLFEFSSVDLAQSWASGG